MSRILWLFAIGIGAAAAALAAPGAAATASVEPARIDAGLFYRGARLTVTGTIGAGSQVAVLTVEPSGPQTFNRRGRIARFVWGGVEHVTFTNAPSVYALHTSAALASLAAPELRARLGLGYDTLRERVQVSESAAGAAAMIDQLVRLKQSEGLYLVAPGAVRLDDVHDGRRAFHASVALPTTTPPGVLDVRIFEFASAALVREEQREVPFARVGLPAAIFRLAHAHGIAYGLLAIVVMIVTGLGTGLLASGRTRTVEDGAGGGIAVRLSGFARDVGGALRPLVGAAPFSADITALQARFGAFRDLLAVNNELLDLLAELEEEASWTSFRQPRVRMAIRALFDGTADMVSLLNRLSSNRYFDLVNVVSSIRRDVTDFLGRLQAEPPHPLTLQAADINSNTAPQVGGKAVNLSRLDCDLHLSIPPFFAITTEAYRELLEYQGLGSRVRTVLAPARMDAAEDFRRRCELAQQLLDETGVPPAVREAIEHAAAAAGIAGAARVAVRSSAAGEDSALSFAGQFESVLNVTPAGVADAWARVVRSRLAPRAVFYRRAAGLTEIDTPMAVVVQQMVGARASGVLFTRQPSDPRAPVLLVTSVLGLGADASAGTARADQFIVSRRAPHQILERRLARKRDRLVGAADGGVTRAAVETQAQLEPSISDGEAAELAAIARRVETYFGCPQDLEWAIDDAGTIWILQARPLRIERIAAAVDAPPCAPLLLTGGDPVWPGRAVGPVFVAASPDDDDRVPRGAVLVTSQLLPDCVRFLPRICGVVVEHGSVTGHAASIVREFRVPALFGVAGAIETLLPGRIISLDAAARRVYAGAVWPELRGRLASVPGERTTVMPDMLASKLTTLSGSTLVSSWACQSLHDVIRFAHEMAIQTMFEVGDRLLEAGIGAARQLESGAPVYLHVVDLGGGLGPSAAGKRRVRAEDVVSAPFRALWDGMTDEQFARSPLGRPRPGALGSVIASAASADGLRSLGAPNYACVGENYLNMNSRQAYHFAIVDAFLSENANGNHVSVRFKGGGAATAQRALRVRFMADVLRREHFTTRVTGDLLNAWCRGMDAAAGARALTTIGRLLRFSAQLDMWMNSDADADRYVDAFVAAGERQGARAEEIPAPV